MSQADHRFNRVEAWVEAHRQTLEQTSGWRIEDKEASIDHWGRHGDDSGGLAGILALHCP